ncbi:MAG: zinc-ribbon domain-containing protein [Sphingomonadales bacterium]
MATPFTSRAIHHIMCIVIVTCPNCGAGFRLDAALVARRPKLKCGDCQHKFVPAEPVDEDEEMAAVQAELLATRATAEPAPTPDPAPEPQPEAANDDTPPAPRHGLVKTVAALAVGGAMAVAAAGLWLGQGHIDMASLPGVGPLLAGNAPAKPAARPLQVSVAATITTLPDGTRVLDMAGQLANPHKETRTLPPLDARLLTADGRTRQRWTIPAPQPQLGPGGKVGWISNATDIPAGPLMVEVRLMQ